MMIRIEILGTGCPKCKQQAALAEQAASELGIEYELVKITKINEIMKFGVMMTPAIAVNGQVKNSGKVASVEAIKRWLQES